MNRIYLFYAVQLLASAYATWRGGAPERIVAALMIAAAVVTSLLPFEATATFRTIDWNALAVDLAFLAALVLVAVRAERYWPLWIAALQLLAIGVHGVRAYDPRILPIVYARIAGELAYPMILLLIFGTLRHGRRVAASGGERDWSPVRW